MKKLLLLSAVFIFSACYSFSQGIAINTDGSNADPSAMLDVKSNNKGILIPRLTKAQRDAMTTPANGLLIYQTDDVTGFWFYNGSTSQWSKLGDNLGNHTLTQNLITGTRYLSRTGDNNGIQLSDQYGSVRFRGISNTSGGNTLTHDLFRFDNEGGFVALGDLGYGIIPMSGAGIRMMWYPFKGAFRAGGVSATEWDDAGVGFYSWAGGNSTKASAYASFAFGDQLTVTGVDGAAFGGSNTVSGTAGFSTGANNVAAGFTSVAMGYTNKANGQGSVAIGYRVNAYSNYCVALGNRASNGGFTGTMVMGDASTTDSVLNTANNQFAARYAGGYRFYSNATKTIGVSVAPGGNSWASISDSTKKEKFQKSDGEGFLVKLRNLTLGSWNYQGQDYIEDRHYGPMAQEIFAAYGKDKYGTIGCDTLLATADMDGIMMIMLQALEKRSTDQMATNKKMAEELAMFKNENKELKDKLAKMEVMQQQILVLQQSMEKLKFTEGSTVVATTLYVSGKNGQK